MYIVAIMRYCFALDLIDDPQVIKEYEEYHEAVWPDIPQSLRDSGIVEMEIYRGTQSIIYDYRRRSFIFFRTQNENGLCKSSCPGMGNF